MRLRRSEGLDLKLFNGKNCPDSKSDRSIEILTEYFNKTADKYGINQCIFRKYIFLSQIYWESGRFRTTLEGIGGTKYNPWTS